MNWDINYTDVDLQTNGGNGSTSLCQELIGSWVFMRGSAQSSDASVFNRSYPDATNAYNGWCPVLEAVL